MPTTMKILNTSSPEFQRTGIIRMESPPNAVAILSLMNVYNSKIYKYVIVYG
ncbi:MAG: hypothetical protein KGD66_09995 [Candidatus Lokiarchaeota archaeon]|nr:hypothetical protein [Candidatus Lokiarchaeota archaeon]